MAQDSWPSPNHNSRAVTEAEYEQVAARFSDNGLYGQPGDPAPVVAGVGLTAVVRAGLIGSVRGFAWTSGTTDVSLTVDPNSSGQTRQDRVVLQLDRATWDVRAIVSKGTPGAAPPALVRQEGDTGVFQELMAHVLVPTGATSVTVTPKPQYVGSRIRSGPSGNRPLNPAMGELYYETDTGRYVGWNGSAWESLGTDDSGDATIALGPKWRQDGSNLVRRVGPVVNIDLNVLFGAAVNEVIFKADVSNLLVGTIPPGFRPPRNKYCVAGLSGGGQVRLQAQPDGKITAWHSSENLDFQQSLRASWSFLI